MKEIYQYYGNYYRKIKAGKDVFQGMYLWQPMKKVLWVFVPDIRMKRFWLDDCGFKKVTTSTREQR